MNNSAQRPLVAVTGATGFIGRRLVPALVRAGFRVRLLLRRDPVQAEWRGLQTQVVAGDLGDEMALQRLVEDARAVVHLAGLIKAARRRQFFAINRDGATAIAQATARFAPQAHFLHLSTIAAREPQLSDYAASKRAGEDAVRATLGERSTVLRPPAVYGPGDRETLVFFQIAKGRRVPLVGRPAARAAMIHVEDLVNLVVALLGETPGGRVLTAADARPEGYSWAEVFAAAARAVGNPDARLFQLPAALLHTVALLGNVGRCIGSANMLNSQKLRELRHLDWSVKPGEWAQVPGWVPRYTLDAGFVQTVAWYRAAGWLPSK